MTCEHATRTMLVGKHILLLSNGEDSTSELGLKLSLYGGAVFVIGNDITMLSQLQREVRDVGEVLNFRIVDYNDLTTVHRVAAHLQSTVNRFHVLVDNSGQTGHYYARALLGTLDHLPDQIITINHANGDNHRLFAAPAGIKTVVVHTDTSDAALPCAEDSIPTDLYSAILAREVVYAIGDDRYHTVNRIALVDQGNELQAQLYRDNGTTSTLADTIRRGRTQKVFIASTGMGRAVFAGCDFKRGEIVFETNGTRIDHQTEHTIQIDWECHFEPDSPIRLINHSCDPNVGVKTNADGLPDFYAFRDIQQGEELTFDYAMTEYMHYPRADESLEFSLECQCGSPDCRGKLGYYSELPETVKRHYAGFVSAYFATPQPNSHSAHSAKITTIRDRL